MIPRQDKGEQPQKGASGEKSPPTVPHAPPEGIPKGGCLGNQSQSEATTPSV